MVTCKANVLLEHLKWEFSVLMLADTRFALMQAENVIGDSAIVFVGIEISNNEDTVEARQDGSLQFDLLLDFLRFVIAAEYRVSCRQHRSLGV